MKKYLIIGLILAVIGAMFIVPLLKEQPEEIELAATFDFQDNLATRWDEAVKINVNVLSEDVAKVELFYNDSLFQTWEKPRTTINY